MEEDANNILVVEDDENIIYLIRHYFEKIDGEKPFEIQHAPNLKIAKQLIASQEFEAVLLDLMLPDSRVPQETVSEIDEIYEGPVIVLTSYSDKNLAKELIREGAEDYLFKDTLNEEILMRTLRYALERHARNFQIKQAEKRFRMMTENNKDGIMIVDQSKMVRYANAFARMMLDDDLVGKPLGLPLPNEKIEVKISPKPGENGIAELVVAETQWNKEDVYMIILHDITESKSKEDELLRLSKKLTQKNKELESLNYYLEDFSQTVAHDLKNPINLVSSFLEMLIEEDESIDSDERLDLMDRALKCSTRMAGLIDDLLELAKNGLQPSSIKDIDINEIVSDVIEDLDLKVKEKKARIEVEELPHMLGNRAQIYQVFINLIGNALKFSKEDTPLELNIFSKSFDRVGSASKKGGTRIAQIYVEDNGIGFDEKYKQYIFKAFNRLHTEEEYEGHGIGLATVKRIITNHCGTIDVKSHAGEGTCFIITIPIELSDKASFLMRREPRRVIEQKPVAHEAIYQNGKEKINFEVVDQSESGMGCSTDKLDNFKEGMILIVEDEIFQVRWVNKKGKKVMHFGLKKI
jgi:signal transduction histidine kinase